MNQRRWRGAAASAPVKVVHITKHSRGLNLMILMAACISCNKENITYRAYSQRGDVVGGNPRDVGGPDANDGLPGAAAC